MGLNCRLNGRAMEGNENKKEAIEGRFKGVSVFQGYRRKRHLFEDLPGNFPLILPPILFFLEWEIVSCLPKQFRVSTDGSGTTQNSGEDRLLARKIPHSNSTCFFLLTSSSGSSSNPHPVYPPVQFSIESRSIWKSLHLPKYKLRTNHGNSTIYMIVRIYHKSLPDSILPHGS
jgi:hypothetical protein